MARSTKVKIITGSSLTDVENNVNTWLSSAGEAKIISLMCVEAGGQVVVVLLYSME